MAINKVIYGNDTLIDLTDSTVNPTNLLAGEKAYGADGEPVFGTLELGSTINITAIDSEFFGEDVTLSDGVTTLIAAFDNQGEATFSSVILTGLLTITCKGLSQTISIQTYGTYNVTFDPVPEGATITPVNSIPIWLRCAHITDKNYTTLAEVLADRETFEILLRDSNACDYMARSTEWAVAIGKVPTMTSNTTPSGECIGQNYVDDNYYLSFNGSTSISDSAVAVTNQVNGFAVGYHFDEPIRLYRVKYWNRETTPTYGVADHKYQGSNDGINWIDLTNTLIMNNPNSTIPCEEIVDSEIAYSYIRLYVINAWNNTSTTNKQTTYCNVSELQFYEADITHNQDAMALIGKYDYCSNALLNNTTWAEAIANSDYLNSIVQPLVPIMTSNTTPSGTVTASSAVGSSKTGDTYVPQNDYYDAFDGNNTSVVGHRGENTSNWWVAYEFPEEVSVNSFSMSAYTFNNAGTFTVYIQYLDATETWQNMGTTFTVVASNTYTFKLTSFVKAKKFRIYSPTLKTSGHALYVRTAQFYGRASKEVLVPLVPTMTSATTPSGEVISSGHSTNYDAWKAFDNDDTTEAAVSAGVNGYIGYRFVNPTCVNAFRIYDNNTKRLLTFKIQASNTGGINDWIDISDVMTMPSSYDYTAEIRKNGILNTESYYYYRVLQVTTSSSVNIAYKTIQFYAKTVQTNIIHSCANDTIYYLDENEEPVVIATTNSDGDGVCDFSLLEDKIYRLYSTVAKDPDNLSNPYSKRVRITKSEFGGTTELYFMPDTVKTLYWWGYESNNLEDCSSANGWSLVSSTYSFIAPTHNIGNIYLNCSSQLKVCGVGCKQIVSKDDITSLKAVYKTKANLCGYNTKVAQVDSNYSDIGNSATMDLLSLNKPSTDKYIFVDIYSESGRTATGTLYAFWYE